MLGRGSTPLSALLAALALLCFFPCSSCSRPDASLESIRGITLAADLPVAVDLDGDGAAETVVLEGSAQRLTITDGSLSYHSRDKWRVLAAALGDTDGNSLPEVVVLLEATDGRHVGLLGYSSSGDEGRYRELLVTSALKPRPLALRVVPARSTPGDLLVLTEEVSSGSSAGAGSSVTDMAYRWNGFGFTALGPTETEPQRR